MNVSRDDNVPDWDHTHKISPTSIYYDGPLDSKYLQNVMSSKYYRDFEEKYKNYPWWKTKKYRIEQTIKDFNSEDPTLIAKAKAQTKVNFSWPEFDMF